jgi:hypothetical protein
MTNATLKQGSAQRESVAFQYRREQVAREMASVYSAFGDSAKASKAVPQTTAKKSEPSKR